MAKIILRQKRKNVALSVAECILLGLGELGSTMVESFFPKRYSFTRPGRLLLGFDRVKPERIRHELWRLQARGLVAKAGRRKHSSYALTPAGHTALRRIAMRIARPDSRDGNWHVVIFDVPERLHKARDALRYELGQLGFRKLQESVWVSQYPVSKEFYEFMEAANLLPYAILLKVTDSSEIEKIKSLATSSIPMT